MIPLKNNSNVDNSDLTNYPDGRVKDNPGDGTGTPVNRNVYGDLHSTISKLMRMYDIVPNEVPDNETTGFQIIEAIAALASKNDFIFPITSSGGILSVGLKLDKMLNGEQVVCVSGINLADETSIKGVNAATFVFEKHGNFKTGEYVRLIKTSSGVTLIRLADDISIDAILTDLSYLKKASQAEENAGTIDTKATTPLSNKTAFAKRVNGTDSPGYLATTTQNGLLSKEDKDKLDNLDGKVRNIGYFSGLNVGVSSGSLAVDGDVVSATVTAGSGTGSTVRVVVANTMTNTEYYVRPSIQSMSSNIFTDGSIGYPVCKPINATTFDINIQELSSQTQNLRMHLEVVKI